MGTTETLLTNKIRVLLSLMKIPHWKVSAGPFGPWGVPDIIGTLPPSGRQLMIEVKSSNSKRSGKTWDAQQAFQNIHKSAGAVVILAYSMLDVVVGLQAAGYERAKEFKI